MIIMNRLSLQATISGAIADYIKTCPTRAGKIGEGIVGQVAAAMHESGCQLYDDATVMEEVTRAELTRILDILQRRIADINVNIIASAGFPGSDNILTGKAYHKKLDFRPDPLWHTEDPGLLAMIAPGILKVKTVVQKIVSDNEEVEAE